MKYIKLLRKVNRDVRIDCHLVIKKVIKLLKTLFKIFFMSGHSKWSKIKHQKGSTDIKRGQSFTKIANSITIAVRQGAGVTDPEANFRLRIAMEKAREMNMPKENISRAVERGKGKIASGNLEEITYEAYGPGGFALLIEAITDNRQRTTAEIKNILETDGGNLSGPGSVSYNFKTQGIIAIKKNNLNPDLLLTKAAETGAQDIEETKDSFLIYTAPDKLKEIKEKLSSLGLTIFSVDFSKEPKNMITINDKSKAEKAVKVIKRLETLDDVLKVYTNLDIPEEISKDLR